VPDTFYVPLMFPVSVKGVVIRDDRVLLLRNERDEWELPGGKIELGETPEECLAREIEEETGWPVRVTEILDSWIYHITQVDRHVFIVTYGCHVDSLAPDVVSSEHKEAGLFTEVEVPDLPMPEGYKRSVQAWFVRSRV
jgi:mutator protein MutT